MKYLTQEVGKKPVLIPDTRDLHFITADAILSIRLPNVAGENQGFRFVCIDNF